MKEAIHVAVGVIVGPDGRILVARRPANVHQGGLWEFPGGKLEPGESVLAALHRELQEELGIEIDPECCHPFTSIAHRYGDRSVFLDVWRVDGYRGSAQGRENQPLAWCLPWQLDPVEFPAANRDIIRLLQLPQRIAITPQCSDRDECRQMIASLLAREIQLIQFRQPDLRAAVASAWVADAVDLCRQAGARLVVNTSVAAFADSPAHGLHLNAARLLELEQRPVSRDLLFSASCHNRAELERAQQLGADFVLLSPVRPTTSHPQAATLGWQGFRALAAQFSMPVYALGGLSDADIATARKAGAHGIAAIRAFLS